MINTDHFKDAKYTTAKQKKGILRDWIRFLKESTDKHFTKRLYNHLIQHCSFIAHYNREGFFATYFANPERFQRFLTQFDREKGCVSVEYGMADWVKGGNDVSQEYYDINNAMVDAVGEVLSVLRKKAKRQEFENACRELNAAKDKVAKLLGELEAE